MKITTFHFKSIPSSNQWAKENYATFPKDHLVIVSADEQTGSRGQYGRKWLAPRGYGLWASFCLCTAEDSFLLTRSMAECLKELLSPLDPKIKLPNDLYVNDKKIAGILTERVDEWAIIGIGLNVNMPKEFLDKIDQPATSILIETGKETSIENILKALITRFYSKSIL